MENQLFDTQYLSALPISFQFISVKPIPPLRNLEENRGTNILIVPQLNNSWVIAQPPYKVINPKKESNGQ